MTLKLVRAGLYARVSSEKQAQEKTIESQIDMIIQHTKQLDVKVDPDLHFIDNGVSGASLERPGLDRLRDKVLSGDVTMIYILSPDRLSRKSAHQILLIEEMKRLGVSVSFVNRHIGETPEDQLLLQVQGIIAEYEREKILERSRRGKLYAAKCGKINVLGGAPYGYKYKRLSDIEDASYIIDLEEAPVVKEAFDLYSKKNYSIGDIAREFTEKGYFTRTKKQFWERSVIWGMLRNPAYKGMAAFRKTQIAYRNKKTKLAIDSLNKNYSDMTSARARPKEEWIYIPVPALVSKDVFDCVQLKLQENIKLATRNNKKNEYLLSGFLRCKTCGYSIYGKCSSNSKYNRKYYRCSGLDGYRWADGRVCSGHPVRTEVLDQLVWQTIEDLLLTPQKVVDEYQQRLSSSEINYKQILAPRLSRNNLVVNCFK